MGGVKFQGFGASHEAYPTPYFTAAAALGTTREEVDVFCARLAKCFADFRKKAKKARAAAEKNWRWRRETTATVPTASRRRSRS